MMGHARASRCGPARSGLCLRPQTRHPAAGAAKAGRQAAAPVRCEVDLPLALLERRQLFGQLLFPRLQILQRVWQRLPRSHSRFKQASRRAFSSAVQDGRLPSMSAPSAALRPPRALRRVSGGGPSLRLAPLRSVPAAGSLVSATRFPALHTCHQSESLEA